MFTFLFSFGTNVERRKNRVTLSWCALENGTLTFLMEPQSLWPAKETARRGKSTGTKPSIPYIGKTPVVCNGMGSTLPEEERTRVIQRQPHFWLSRCPSSLGLMILVCISVVSSS